MKISITVSDLTQTEAEKVLSDLGGAARTINTVIRDLPVIADTSVLTQGFEPPAPPSAPLPMPPVPAAPQTPAPVAAQTTDEQVDARGFPWDARIHSSNKKLTSKGVWTTRRGAQQAEIDSVEMELRAKMGATAQAAPQAPAFVAPVTPPVQSFVPPQAPAPVAVAMPAPPSFEQATSAAPAPAPAMMPAAPQAPAAPAEDYQGLINTVSALFPTGALTPVSLNEILAKIGGAYNVQVGSITDLGPHPHMVQYAFQLLREAGKIA